MTANRITDLWGARTPYAPGEAWPQRVDEHLVGTPDSWVQTASVLHSNGDAMDIGVRDGRIVGVRGRPNDRVNHGRLDVKDLYGWQANNAVDRLQRPLLRRDGALVEVDWETAMAAVVNRCQAVINTRGPSGVAFYTTGSSSPRSTTRSRRSRVPGSARTTSTATLAYALRRPARR